MLETHGGIPSKPRARVGETIGCGRSWPASEPHLRALPPLRLLATRHASGAPISNGSTVGYFPAKAV